MQNNLTTTASSGPQPGEFEITCKSGRKRMRAHALEMCIRKYGVRVSGKWEKITPPLAPDDVRGHLQKLSDDLRRKRPPQKLLRSICLVDNGLVCSYRGPVYKIALYCLAAFEHDSRAWWNPNSETVEIWDDARHRRFRAMMCALGFSASYKFYKGDRPTPDELYLGRLLAADLGLSGLAAYADIFGGNRADLAETAILYQIPGEAIVA